MNMLRTEIPLTLFSAIVIASIFWASVFILLGIGR